MRKPLIAGNWKMHKTVAEATQFMNQLKEKHLPSDVDKVICAPFLSLPQLVEVSDLNVPIGAQNVHHEEQGAYTGEVSVPMLQAIGVSYVIIGHSERRALFAETDEQVVAKTKAALAGGLTPIVCVGEQLSDREAGETETVVGKQVQAVFEALTESEASQVVLAYEPVWAIGSGKAATAQDAEAVCAFIRKQVESLTSPRVAEQVRIQYGGSVKPQNIADFLAEPNIDGALVGGASLDAESFYQLLEGASGS